MTTLNDDLTSPLNILPPGLNRPDTQFPLIKQIHISSEYVISIIIEKKINEPKTEIEIKKENSYKEIFPALEINKIPQKKTPIIYPPGLITNKKLNRTSSSNMLLSIEIPETPKNTSSFSSEESYNLLTIERPETPPIPKSESFLHLMGLLPPPPNYPPPIPNSETTL